MPRPRPTPKPTLKLVWSVVVTLGMGVARSEAIGLFVAVASEAIAASCVFVAASAAEASALVAEALFVSEVVVPLGFEVDVSLALASVRVLPATTLLDVLETLDAELDGLGSVMLK